MGAAEIQIPLFEAPGHRTQRREAREVVVRHVEYCRFPRMCADQKLRFASTRDISPSGLCLRVDGPEPVGALLRLTVRHVDGTVEREVIAQVAWTKPALDGAHWLGLAHVEAVPFRPIRIRRARHPEWSAGVA